MQDGKLIIESIGHCSPERAERFTKTRLEVDDLLIAKDGGTLGKTAFVPISLAGGNVTQHVLRFPISQLVFKLYVRLVIDSPHGQAWMRTETKGVALPGVNVGDFRRMPVPLPPLAEQQRIVAKVDELMHWCDALEARLTAARTTATALLDATLHQILAG
jgi:type I restriction enzyme S subunit